MWRMVGHCRWIKEGRDYKTRRELARWQAADRTDFSVSVNISSIQFRRGDVEETVLRALAASGASPSGLDLELTESILIDDAEQVLATIRRLTSAA